MGFSGNFSTYKEKKKKKVVHDYLGVVIRTGLIYIYTRGKNIDLMDIFNFYTVL